MRYKPRSIWPQHPCYFQYTGRVRTLPWLPTFLSLYQCILLSYSANQICIPWRLVWPFPTGWSIFRGRYLSRNLDKATMINSRWRWWLPFSLSLMSGFRRHPGNIWYPSQVTCMGSPLRAPPSRRLSFPWL